MGLKYNQSTYDSINENQMIDSPYYQSVNSNTPFPPPPNFFMILETGEFMISEAGDFMITE